MSYGSNVYYNPEKHDLEVVFEIEYSDLCYQYDTRVVWRHKQTGVLYTARDSGCSCPTPFEDYAGVADLERFDPSSILNEIDYEAGKNYGDFSQSDAVEST